MTLAFGGTGLDVPEPVRARPAGDDVPGRPGREDPTPWGPEAGGEASVRPERRDLPPTSREPVGPRAEPRAGSTRSTSRT